MKAPATIPEIAEQARQLLATGRAYTVDELVDELEGLGLDLGPEPAEIVEELLYDDDARLAVRIGDDRFASLAALLMGRTFTHRVSALEVELGFIDVDPDLTPISMLTDDAPYRQLVDGTELFEALPSHDAELLADRGIPLDAVPAAAWVLQPDSLSRLGVAAGDLVAVTVRPDGFELAAAAASEAATDDAQRLRTAFAVGDSEPREIFGVVWGACADDPDLFRAPVAPLGELLEAAGLEWDGDWLATAGFDFAGWKLDSLLNRLQRLYRIDEDQALAVAVLSRNFEDVDLLVRAVREQTDAGTPIDEAMQDLLPDDAEEAAVTGRPAQHAGEPSADDPGSGAGPDGSEIDHRTLVRELLPQLAEPSVAEALLAETVGDGRERAASLGVFAESLIPRAPRSARPALHWLMGRAFERVGRLGDAERAYDAALGIDPNAELPLYALARFASDRGDAERGLSLLRRAGAAGDDALVELLEHFRPVARRDIGRNSPCWCGSGRKYKVCHLRNEVLPLAERAAWLYQKAGGYLQDGPFGAEVVALAAIRARYWIQYDGLLQALQEPFVSDVILFEGGVFEEFLAERGELLPDDERLLAEQWLLVERSVYEIETVAAGSGFTARDIRTGDRVDVRERAGSSQLEPAMMFLARLVPAGDTIQCFGGMEPVELHERDELIALLDSEPDPDELVAFMTRRFAPPVMLNTESEPLMLCESVLRCTDPAALSLALDRSYDRLDDEPRWHEHVTTHGQSRIRATLALEGDQLTVETNSENRMDRVLGRLHELDPELDLLSQTRRSFDDLREAMSRTPGEATAQPLEPTDPAIAAAIEEMIRGWEAQWLDEHIPALAGATPREAAADPTRRPDLVRLLDTFGPGGPGQMDPDRLRTALGL